MSILSQQKQSVNTDFPNLRPSLDLRFALAKKLDPRITFTRGSSGTYFGPDGLMRTAGVNEPRFDHDPVTGQSLGLLVEESRTNLYTRSDIEGTVGNTPTSMSFAGGATGQSAVVSTDVSLGPNGQSAKHIRGTSADNNVGFQFGVTVVAGSTYVFSTYVYIPSSQAKNFSGRFVSFIFESAFTSRTTASADVTIVDRWQRVTGTCVPSGTTATWVARTNANAGSFFYTDCWQLELGAFPTSYMPASGGSQFTRSQDNASMTGTNFSSWYNQTEGTFFTDVKSSSGFIAVNACLFMIFGTANQIVLGNYHTLSSVWVFRNSFASNNAFFNVNMSTTQNRKSIATYKTGTADYYTAAFGGSNLRNSTTSATSTNPRTGTLRTDQISFELNPNKSGLVPLNGTISRLTYYPIQLTNQQLINLTS